VPGEVIDEAFVQILPQLQEFAARLNAGLAAAFRPAEAVAESAGEDIENSFDEAARQSTQHLRGVGGPGTFAPVVTQAQVAGEAVERAFNDSNLRVRGSFSGLSLVGVGAIAGIGVAAAGATAGLVGFGLKGAAALEQTQVGFEALLGSAEEADAFIKEMQQFAATTPFEFQGLADSARRLLAIGDAAGIAEDEVLSSLTAIGDITAVLGAPADSIDRITTAFGQMASRGKVSLEEINQLSEALPGFSGVAAIAAAQGISTAEAMEKISAGEIGAKEGIDALLEGMREFPGAAGAMAAQAETLNGLFSTFKDTIAISLTEAFQPLVPAVKDGLKDLTPAIQEALGSVAPAVSDLVQGLIPIVVELVEVLGPILGRVLTTVGRLFAEIAPAIGPLGDAFNSVLDAVLPIVGVLGQLIGTLLPPLAAVITSVAVALAPVIELFAQFLSDALEQLQPILPVITDAIGQIAAALGESLLVLLPPLIELMLELLTTFLPLAPIVLQLVAAIIQLLPPILQLTSTPLRLLINLLVILLGAIQPLIPVIVQLAQTLISWFGRAVASVRGFVADIGNNIRRLRDNFVTGFNEIVSRVRTWINDMIARVRGFIGNFRSVGSDLIDGFVQGVRNAASRLANAAAEAARAALTAAKHALGIGSPSKAFMEVGEDSGEGFIIGLKKRLGGDDPFGGFFGDIGGIGSRPSTTQVVRGVAGHGMAIENLHVRVDRLTERDLRDALDLQQQQLYLTTVS
jgi:tape measure domain-containing protein